MVSKSNSWQDRPIEVRNLLNPAFCAILLHGGIKDYQKTHPEGMPFPLVLLLLPLILPRDYRKILPANTNAKLPSWLLGQDDIKLGIQQRIQSTKEISSEALLFGAFSDIFNVSLSGNFQAQGKIKHHEWGDTEENKMLLASKLLGRWFAKYGVNDILETLWVTV